MSRPAPYLTPSELARRLDRDPAQVSRWIARGVIRSCPTAGQTAKLIPVAEAERLEREGLPDVGRPRKSDPEPASR